MKADEQFQWCTMQRMTMAFQVCLPIGYAKVGPLRTQELSTKQTRFSYFRGGFVETTSVLEWKELAGPMAKPASDNKKPKSKLKARTD